ncbi:MAG: hypothetical protein Q7R95_04140, partial [bacterium]|nr:hypothetical protein [bacterium]
TILYIYKFMATKATDLKSALVQLEDTLELYLVKKAPFTLPDNVKEIIVKFAPYLSILMLVVAIPGILLALGLGSVVAPFTAMMGPQYAVSYGMGYVVSMAVLAVSVVLEAMAVPGLFSRSLKAWHLLFYASLISAVSSLLSGQIVSAIIGAVIGLYFLFQVKSYYK